MSLNKTESDTYRALRKVPLDQLLAILLNELGNVFYLELDWKTGTWRPTLACWKILRRHGWTSTEFMETELRH